MAKLGFPTKLAFGIGQLAEGAKNAAFSLLLFFYYTQVLGLSGTLTGAALFIALAFDAVTDPLAGSLSDGLRHRWGRRHPFMYGAAVPLAVFFSLTFSPPAGLGQLGLFAWLTIFGVLSRGAMTLYHVPHLALGAELSDDYRERTVVVAYRTVFGVSGAALLLLLGFTLFLGATPEFPTGQLNPAGYPRFGLFFGGLMAVAILISALGTHSRIPYLPRPPQDLEPFSATRLGREILEALANGSFRAVFLALVWFYVARGVDATLLVHMGTYFWQLSTDQVRWLPVMSIVGVLVGTPVWAALRGQLEKRTTFLIGIFWFSCFSMLLPLFKIAGWFPAQASAVYFPTIIGGAFLGALSVGGALLASGSMLADVADEHELRTQRRQEGIFFGALSFSSKASIGIGGFVGGVGLDLIRFPTSAAPGTVPEPTLIALGLLYGPGVFAGALLSVWAAWRYRIDRQRLAEIQAELRERRGGAERAEIAPTANGAVAMGERLRPG